MSMKQFRAVGSITVPKGINFKVNGENAEDAMRRAVQTLRWAWGEDASIELKVEPITEE